MENLTPTGQAYTEFQDAYDFYNLNLFDGQLPGCLFTMQRKARTYGYFSSNRFVNRSGAQADEIALNPEIFAVVPLVEILQTMVHEMAHQWQQRFGTPGRRRYHNKEWGDKMESIGLMPSNTGKEGGRKTGEQMMDYPIAGGRFEKVTARLLATHFGITWLDRFPARRVATMAGMGGAFQFSMEETQDAEESYLLAADDPALQVVVAEPNRSNRWKYSCGGCGVNVWGKPSLKINCGDCQEEFISDGVG